MGTIKIQPTSIKISIIVCNIRLKQHPLVLETIEVSEDEVLIITEINFAQVKRAKAFSMAPSSGTDHSSAGSSKIFLACKYNLNKMKAIL